MRSFEGYLEKILRAPLMHTTAVAKSALTPKFRLMCDMWRLTASTSRRLQADCTCSARIQEAKKLYLSIGQWQLSVGVRSVTSWNRFQKPSFATHFIAWTAASGSPCDAMRFIRGILKFALRL